MTHGSLFSGIGGFDLGFERAGFETVWQVEIDEYCRRVLERHFPRAERFADIRECGAHNLKQVDVISGGFPCQDISYASNSGVGIDGERSGLWREMRRIIAEVRPQVVIVENVAALLDRGMGRVLGDLADLGFDAEWSVFSACRMGAPHMRKRVFTVAYADGDRLQAWSIAARRPSERIHGEASDSMAGCGEFGSSERWRKWPSDTGLRRMAHGLPNRMDRLSAIGNAVMPQIAQWIAERIKAITA